MSRRKGIMLCYPFEEKRLAKWNPPYLVQPKLDGDRCKTIYLTDPSGAIDLLSPTLLSSEENTISSVPHINQAIVAQGLIGQPLDGELYIHGRTTDGENGIRSISSRTVNIHQDHEAMEYHIFDLASDEPQWKRTRRLLDMNVHPPLKIVPSAMANDLDEVIIANDMYVEMGYEGIIVRHMDAPYIKRRSTFVMKFKPKKKDYYLISDIHEAFTKDTKEPKGMAGAIECIDDMGTTFRTAPGIGWTEEAKKRLWHKRKDMIGRWCEVHYQNITSGKNVPRFGRFVEIVDVNPEKVSPIDLPV